MQMTMTVMVDYAITRICIFIGKTFAIGAVGLDGRWRRFPCSLAVAESAQ